MAVTTARNSSSPDGVDLISDMWVVSAQAISGDRRLAMRPMQTRLVLRSLAGNRWVTGEAGERALPLRAGAPHTFPFFRILEGAVSSEELTGIPQSTFGAPKDHL